MNDFPPSTLTSRHYFSTKYGKYFHATPKCGRWPARVKRTAEWMFEFGKSPCSLCVQEVDFSNNKISQREGDERLKRHIVSVAKYRSTADYRWSILKSGARLRGLTLTLSKEEAIAIMKNPCFYCGFKSESSLNGLDRANNSLGYEHENILPCCARCNRMKWIHSIQDFTQACKNVAYPEAACYDFHDDKCTHKAMPYSLYRCSAYQRQLEFEISKTEYEKCCAQSCYYCFKPSSFDTPMGIDRRMNHLGYMKDNIVACCYRCNRMKHVMDEDTFRAQCKLIADSTCEKRKRKIQKRPFTKRRKINN